MNEKLEPLKSFVLPGGTALAAHLLPGPRHGAAGRTR